MTRKKAANKSPSSSSSLRTTNTQEKKASTCQVTSSVEGGKVTTTKTTPDKRSTVVVKDGDMTPTTMEEENMPSPQETQEEPSCHSKVTETIDGDEGVEEDDDSSCHSVHIILEDDIGGDEDDQVILQSTSIEMMVEENLTASDLTHILILKFGLEEDLAWTLFLRFTKLSNDRLEILQGISCERIIDDGEEIVALVSKYSPLNSVICLRKSHGRYDFFSRLPSYFDFGMIDLNSTTTGSKSGTDGDDEQVQVNLLHRHLMVEDQLGLNVTSPVKVWCPSGTSPFPGKSFIAQMKRKHLILSQVDTRAKIDVNVESSFEAFEIVSTGNQSRFCPSCSAPSIELDKMFLLASGIDHSRKEVQFYVISCRSPSQRSCWMTTTRLTRVGLSLMRRYLKKIKSNPYAPYFVPPTPPVSHHSHSHHHLPGCPHSTANPLSLQRTFSVGSNASASSVSRLSDSEVDGGGQQQCPKHSSQKASLTGNEVFSSSHSEKTRGGSTSEPSANFLLQTCPGSSVLTSPSHPHPLVSSASSKASPSPVVTTSAFHHHSHLPHLEITSSPPSSCCCSPTSPTTSSSHQYWRHHPHPRCFHHLLHHQQRQRTSPQQFAMTGKMNAEVHYPPRSRTNSNTTTTGSLGDDFIREEEIEDEVAEEVTSEGTSEVDQPIKARETVSESDPEMECLCETRKQITSSNPWPRRRGSLDHNRKRQHYSFSGYRHRHDSDPDSIPWFYESMSREMASSLLSKYSSINGVFLVRTSTRQSGQLVLSFTSNGKISHAQIHRIDVDSTTSCLTIDSGATRFYDLKQLIEFHQLNLSPFLGIKLTHYVVHAGHKNGQKQQHFHSQHQLNLSHILGTNSSGRRHSMSSMATTTTGHHLYHNHH